MSLIRGIWWLLPNGAFYISAGGEIEEQTVQAMPEEVRADGKAFAQRHVDGAESQRYKKERACGEQGEFLAGDVFVVPQAETEQEDKGRGVFEAAIEPIPWHLHKGGHGEYKAAKQECAIAAAPFHDIAAIKYDKGDLIEKNRQCIAEHRPELCEGVKERRAYAHRKDESDEDIGTKVIARCVSDAAIYGLLCLRSQ